MWNRVRDHLIVRMGWFQPFLLNSRTAEMSMKLPSKMTVHCPNPTVTGNKKPPAGSFMKHAVRNSFYSSS